MTSEANRHSAVLRFANGSAREQTTLLPGQSVSLQYGTPTVGYDPATVSIAEAPARLPKRVPPAPFVAAPRQDPAPTSTIAPAPDLRIERVIGYLPLNWNNSGAYSDSIPRPSELKRAGYTHILIAFGIFSTDPHCADTASCVLLSARDGAGAKISSGDGTERRPLEEYVAELKSQGIRVLLSIGGASSHFGTVDFEASFRQVQNGTLDFRRTVNAFVDSLTHLTDRYGFDGVDIDIEVRLSAPRSTDLRAAGSVQTCERRFTRASGLSPDSGSVCALTAVLRTLLQRDPELLLSLAPQTLNIAANHQIGGSVMNLSLIHI